MIEYDCLRIIWWLLLGVLLSGFAIMDGFDFGVGLLHPFVAKTDTERRITINAIAGTWEGNQVWFILGGGAVFAAWPILYSVSFSAYYLAFMIILAGFIIRPVALKYRSKINNPRWRATWDWLIFASALIPSLCFGVFFGNVLQGAGFYFDPDMYILYENSFWELFDPFSLLCGILSIAMFIAQGGLYLVSKTGDEIAVRAKKYALWATILIPTLFVLCGIWVHIGITGYEIVSPIPANGPSNPLAKTVIAGVGGWTRNYGQYPWMLLAPVLSLLLMMLTIVLIKQNYNKLAFVSNSLSMTGIIATFGFSLYPFLLPSAYMPSHSLTIWDASSSQLTLFLMLIATLIFMPIVLLYTTWVYRVLRGKITEHFVNTNDSAY